MPGDGNKAGGAGEAPEATQAAAQTREGSPAEEVPAASQPLQGDGGGGGPFRIGSRLTHGADLRTYERRARDPIYRPLRIFTLDPAERKLDGAYATLEVPYEPLDPGPAGRLFAVEETDGTALVDLEDPRLLLTRGHDPSPSNPQFHQQMVYAVCSSVYAVFRTALGRQISWAFDGADSGGARLRLIPHDPAQGANAEYIRADGAIRFGFYAADATNAPRVIPGARVFTCLSHDIIVHELTHALLDGLRSSLLLDTSRESAAFHEGFADLIALFQHFSYRNVVAAQVRQSRGRLEQAELLTNIARQFGLTTTGEDGLRTPIDHGGERRVFSPDMEPHAMGSVMVAAVFDAFLAVYRRKTERYLRLCGLGPDDTPALMNNDLVDILAEVASQLASQFLSLCVRAIDYCPPVNLQLGEFLRAVITADRDLIPDDPWGYREALIDAFTARHIYPPDIMQLSEDALLWRSPRQAIAPINELSFAELRFSGDPSLPASADQLRLQARALGAVITRPENLHEFGLAAPSDAIDLPTIESIRTSRRVGPDGQIVFDLVAEVTQRRRALDPATGRQAVFLGGSTILLDPHGAFRYVISKHVLHDTAPEPALS